MKKTVLFLLGLLMISSASANDDVYYPLVREGVTWYFVRYKGLLYNNSYYRTYYLYSFNFDGDTTVMDKVEMKTYKKVAYKEYDNRKNVTYSATLRGMREESKVVYVKDLYENRSELAALFEKPFLQYHYWWGWDEDNSQYYSLWNNYEMAIYDFNRESFLSDDHGISISKYFRKNCSATTVTVDGESHDAYIVDDGLDYYSATIIEGIGVDSDAGHLLAPQYTNILEAGAASLDGLAWVEENGKIIYKGVMYDKAMEYLGTETDISTIEGDRQVTGVRYYNLAGVESAQPVKGVNIKVTTYSDGTTKSEKIVR